ncbi:hypothetical protein EBQ81_04665 [bacterium]|nr:hypothetical protein [bacterium]
MKIRRQKIKERVGSIHWDDLSGYFDDIIKFLSERKAYYEQKFPDAYEIWVDYDIDVCDMDESIKQFDIFIERPENDQEYNARVKKLMKIKNQERSAKEQEEYEEYKTYLRLKKKYSK